MLTRRNAFKLGFGAAIYALFGKFLPKKAAEVFYSKPIPELLEPLTLGGDITRSTNPWWQSSRYPVVSENAREALAQHFARIYDPSPLVTKLLSECADPSLESWGIKDESTDS